MSITNACRRSARCPRGWLDIETPEDGTRLLTAPSEQITGR